MPILVLRLFRSGVTCLTVLHYDSRDTYRGGDGHLVMGLPGKLTR